MLHACDSESSGHSAPPQVLLTCTARVRACEPVSQFLSHSPHEDQLVTSQLTGQQPVLQSCASCRAPHGAPPQAAPPLVTVRVRVVRPPPHDFEHVLHSDQFEDTQAFGQQTVLQAFVSDKDGHASPPYAAVSSM